MEVPQCLFDNFIRQGWAYSDQMLTHHQIKSWRQMAQEKLNHGHFRPAQVASGSQPHIRSDSIYWLEEAQTESLSIFKTLHEWRQQLTRELCVSAPQVEAHFACYAPGNSYHKHCDQPKNSQARVITFIIYLHDNWAPGMGGELVIFENENDEVGTFIEPQPGRVVFFKSDEIWHQVQQSNFNRLSLTGWFRHP
ncbi:MAG: 2OG-Fe(II) oxygenase [Bdellovibrionales bacterium]